MQGACHCGMAIEEPSRQTTCQECGTPGCRSCALQVGAGSYCRWCAVSATAAA
jgi:hypothetical protein